MDIRSLFVKDNKAKAPTKTTDISEEELLAELGDTIAPAPKPPVKIREPIKIEEVFSQANLPQVKFPAEKLLKMLDGMSSLTAETQRISVQAMAAAGDWTVDEVVADAAAKLKIIDKTIEEFGESSTALDAKTLEDIAHENKCLAEATKIIQEEIQKLEVRLQDEMKSVKENIEHIRNSSSDKQDEISECVADMRKEQKKYQRITAMFPPPKETIATKHIPSEDEILSTELP